MDNELYAIDRIIDNVVVLENIKTKEIREVALENFSFNIHEGAIVKFYNNKFILDLESEQKRRQEILERFKNLRKNG